MTRSSGPPAKGRFFSRLQAPVSPGEVRRMERWLATARVFLAISALVAIWMAPEGSGYSIWVYWFLGLYIVHGVVVMLLLRYRNESITAVLSKLSSEQLCQIEEAFRSLVAAADEVIDEHPQAVA